MRLKNTLLLTILALGLGACTRHEVDSNAREAGRKPAKPDVRSKKGPSQQPRKPAKSRMKSRKRPKKPPRKSAVA